MADALSSSVIATLIRLNIPLVTIGGETCIPVKRLQEFIEANRVDVERLAEALKEARDGRLSCSR